MSKASPELKAKKQALELEKLEQEVKQAKEDAVLAANEAYASKLRREQYERTELDRVAREHLAGRYDFTTVVDDASVGGATNWLAYFSKRNPGKPITLEVNSPGGSVTAGLKLMDSIFETREAGHEVTVKVYGFAASMAGVIAQAATHRLIGKSSLLHLHEASSFMMGGFKYFEVKDAADRLAFMTRQCMQAYTQRSSKWTVEDLIDRVGRHEWWLDADEAIENEFMDGRF